MSSNQFCTFYVDDLLFGIDVLDVQEVLHNQPMTRIPLAPSTVRGLINLRGRIVTAIDLRRCMALPDRQSDKAFMNIILYAGESLVSLLVDQMGDVLAIDDAQFEAPPQNLHKAIKNLVKGVYKLEKGLLLVLNTHKTVEAETLQIGSSKGS